MMDPAPRIVVVDLRIPFVRPSGAILTFAAGFRALSCERWNQRTNV